MGITACQNRFNRRIFPGGRPMIPDELPEETARSIGKWPGVAAYTHHGDVYCVDCAEENGYVDLSEPIDGSEIVDDSWTSALLANVQDFSHDRCSACWRLLPLW